MWPACSVAVRAQDRESEARQHFQAGQRAEEAGSFAVAVQEYQKVIAILPDAAEAYASLGLVYNAEDEFAASEQALEKAETLKPGLTGVSLYLGIDLVKLNRSAAAIRYLREAIRLEPANKEARLWLSTALTDTDQPEEAIDALRKANSLFPSDPVILFQLGEAYREAADTGVEHILVSASGQPLVQQVYGDIYKDEQLWTKAAGHYWRAVTEDRKWTGAHLGLGEVALRQEKLDDAEREFRLELEIAPRSASADAELAEIALLKGDSAHALALLQQAIAISPSQSAFALGLPPETGIADSQISERDLEQLRGCIPSLLDAPTGRSRTLALSFIDWRLGRNQDFLTNWKQFQSTLPHPIRASPYRIALDDFYRGDMEAAELQLRSWVKTHPNDLQAAYLLARSYRRLALSVLEQLLAVAPDSYPAHVLLAESYENAENYGKAIAEYRTVEKMAPELPGVHFALGHLLVKTGDLDHAVTEFTAELRINPNHAGANAELGATLVALHEQTKGIAYLKKAIVLNPDLWAAHRELGHAYYMQKNLVLAQDELQKAVSHDPDGSAHYQLGLLYRALGRYDEAKKMFAQAQQIKADQLADADSARALPEPPRP